MLEIQKFEQEIKKGLPKILYFCYSQEPFFLFEGIKLIRKNFDPISVEIYESPDEIDKNSIVSTSLFTQKRILIVYNFEKIKKTEKRIDWLKRVINQNTTISIIIMCNVSFKELSEEISYLKKDKNSTIFNFDIPEKDLPEWIKYKASEQGINLKPNAVFYLIDITGGQPGLISSEIEKIALLTEKSSIDLFEIKDILTELGEFNAFDLIEAIKRKNKEKAFRILDKLKNMEPDIILGALNWYYSNKAESNEKIYSILYNANLSSRQSRSCSLDMLVYELMKERDKEEILQSPMIL